MVSFEVSAKEFLFLKQTVETMTKYIVRTVYNGEDVLFDIPEKSLNDFLLDYRSFYVRKGLQNEEEINDTGVRLNRIYEEHIEPVLKENNM